jgi:ribonuclease HI
MDQALSPPEYVNCGIPQGSPLSVILFLIYIDSIPIDKDSDSLFVDDCALLSSGPSLAEATSQLQERLNAIEAWARPRHISFNPEKCLILPTKRSGSSSLRLTFYDLPLPVVFEATYLGIKFQTSSSSTPGWKLTGHSSDLRNKASQKSALFRHLRCSRFGLSFGTLRIFFQGWILGLISYSNSILAHLPDDSRLETTYRKCLRDLTGLPHDAPNSIVYSVSGFAPLFHLRHARAETNAARLLSLPPNHPLARRFWRWIDKDDPNYNLQHHTSFTEERDFLQAYHLDDLEHQRARDHYRLPDAGAPQTPLSLQHITMAPNPGPPCDFSIWTDGSYYETSEHGAGACIILNDAQEVVHQETAGYSQLVSSTGSEYIGLTLGLDWAAKNITGQLINVYCDSSSALRSLARGLNKPSSSLLREKARMALLRAQAYNEITFVHIPGHTGIALNERVDKMAKAATQGSTRLPPSYDTQWFRLHASAFLGTPHPMHSNPAPYSNRRPDQGLPRTTLGWTRDLHLQNDP